MLRRRGSRVVELKRMMGREQEEGVNEVMFLASASQSQKLTTIIKKSGKRC